MIRNTFIYNFHNIVLNSVRRHRYVPDHKF